MDSEHMDESRKGIGGRLDIIKAICAILLIYVIFYFSGIGCPIKFLTGVSCMGCGMTRAWGELMHLNIYAAFACHPLVLLPIPGIFFLLFRRKINVTFFNMTMFVIVSAFTAVYIARMLDPTDTIVVFEPQKGFLYKIIGHIISFCT